VQKNMARIAGVDLPKEKRVEVGLTYIYGIGLSSSKKILEKAGVDPKRRGETLSIQEFAALSNCINEIL
jgi:small subunit ribosomal protein S13